MAEQVVTFNNINSDIDDRFLNSGQVREMINCKPNDSLDAAEGTLKNIRSTLFVECDFGDTGIVFVGGTDYSRKESIIGLFKGDTYPCIICRFDCTSKTAKVIFKHKGIVLPEHVINSPLDKYLFLIDTNQVVFKIDLDKAEDGSINENTGTDLLKLDKLMPTLGPQLGQARLDRTLTQNNIKHMQFQFCYAWYYDDYSLSAWSPISRSTIIPTQNPVSLLPDDVSFIYNALEISVETGSSAVREIWIAMRNSASNDFVIADKLKKDDIAALVDNSTYTYIFTNTKYSLGYDQVKILANTNNPYHSVKALATTPQNFVALGGLTDYLKQPDVDITFEFYQGDVLTTKDRLNLQYKYGCEHTFGIIFHDKYGRTPGVISKPEWTIRAPNITGVDNSGTIGTDGKPGAKSGWNRFTSGTPLGTFNNSAMGFLPLYMKYSITFNDVPDWVDSYAICYGGNKTATTYVQLTISDAYKRGDYWYMSVEGYNTFGRRTGSVVSELGGTLNFSAYKHTEGDIIRFICDDAGKTDTDTGVSFGGIQRELLGYATPYVDSGGATHYDNTLYVRWDANVEKYFATGAFVEIFTPGTDMQEKIFYSIPDSGVRRSAIDFTANSSIAATTRGGDSFAILREQSVYKYAELEADFSTSGEDNRDDNGFVPKLNVLIGTDNISPVEMRGASQNVVRRPFFNVSGSTNRKYYAVRIEIEYNFSVVSEGENNYGVFMIRQHRPGSNGYTSHIIDGDTDNASQSISFNGYQELEIMVYGRGTSVSDMNALELCIKAKGSGDAIWCPENAGYIKMRVRIFEGDTEAEAQADMDAYPKKYWVENQNFNDWFPTNNYGVGRPYAEEDKNSADKVYNQIIPTGKYFADTKIDDTNRISSSNPAYIPYEYGEIQYMGIVGELLKVLTTAKEISIYLGREKYMNADMSDSLALSSSDLGTVYPVQSSFGTVNPESVLRSNRWLYYYDREHMAILRSAPNGQINILEYGMKTWAADLLARLSADDTVKCFIGYASSGNEVLVTFIINGITQPTAVFNESKNQWTHKIDYNLAEGNKNQGYIHYKDNLMVMYDGKWYLHEEGLDRNTFFGEQKTSLVKFYVNEAPLSSKVFTAMAYRATHLWEVDVETPPRGNYTYGQKTHIYKSRFRIKEGAAVSDIPRNLMYEDGTERKIGYATGNPMRGDVATVTMTLATQYDSILSAVAVIFEPSNI